MQQTCKVTYISNAGVMLEYHDKKILIDGLCNSILSIYKNPPEEIMEKMIGGIPPFNNIDALLFTHNHSDHFDAKSTVEFLKNNGGSAIIATNDVIKEIADKISGAESRRLIELNLRLRGEADIRVRGIGIKALSMLHDGKKYADVKNLAYLIDIEGKKVLHTGDAKAIEENYMGLNLPGEGIDLLIAPFPYVSLPRGRQVIEEYIKPKKIVANHLPYNELDRFGWIKSAKKNYMKVQDDFIETIFFEELGYSLNI